MDCWGYCGATRSNCHRWSLDLGLLPQEEEEEPSITTSTYAASTRTIHPPTTRSRPAIFATRTPIHHRPLPTTLPISRPTPAMGTRPKPNTRTRLASKRKRSFHAREKQPRTPRPTARFRCEDPQIARSYRQRSRESPDLCIANSAAVGNRE